MSRSKALAAFAVVSLFGAAEARAADTLPNGSAVSYPFTGSSGTWNVGIAASCVYSPLGVGSSNCSSEQVIGTFLPDGSLQLTYTGVSGSLWALQAAGATSSDLSFTENVTAPAGKQVASVSETVTGSTSPNSNGSPSTNNQTDLAHDTASMTINTTSQAASPIPNATTSGGGTVTLTALENVLNISKDVKDGSGSVSDGNYMSLDTVVQTFTLQTTVPEPASFSLLAMGLAGLLGLRRRQR